MKHFRLLTLAFCALFGLSAYAQEDITDTYLRNAGLSTIDYGWDYYSNEEGAWKYTDWKTDSDVPVVEFYSGWGSREHDNFKFSQTISLPAGDYHLEVNAFFRNGDPGDGTNPDKAWIFAGDKKQNVIGLSSAGVAAYTGSNDLYKAANAFSLGNFKNGFDFSLSEQTTIEIGFQGCFDGIRQWCILGPVKLFKYSLEDYLVDYREKVSYAQSLYEQPMNKEVLAALKAAIIDERNFRLGSEVSAAISALNEKIIAAEQSIQNYKDALAVINAASTLTSTGQADYAASEIVQQIKAEYDARTLVSLTDEQKAAAKEALAAAVKKQTEDGADYTPAAPTTWVGESGSYQGRSERYNDGGSLKYTGDVMTQTIEGVPAGTYKVVLDAAASFTDGRGFTAKTGDDLAVVFANAQTTNLPVVNRTGINSVEEYGPIEVIGKVGADGVLKYGIQKIDEEGGNWFVVGLVSITKVEYVPVTAIEAADITIEVAESTPIEATVTPENATLSQLTYSSDNEEIATVDKNGVVTGVATGIANITIKADEIAKVILVTVTGPAVAPESITLDPTEIEFNLGDENLTATIAAVISPAEASQEVTFASSDPAVATVSETGVVSAVNVGEAIITVTSKADETVQATAKVTVKASDFNSFIATEIEDGVDYWIVNAATGKFLGGANSWGTRASLIKHGIPFKAVAVADKENTFFLDSYTSNGGESHYLAGEYIDGGATEITLVPHVNTFEITDGDDVIEMENTSFNIKIGDNMLVAKTTNTEVDVKAADENDVFAQWYFISKEDQLLNLMMAEEENPVDATFFIKDFNFNRNNTQYSAWKWTFADPNNQNHNNAGDNTNLCVESYHAAFDMSQPLVLPNGTYKLTAQGFYRMDAESEDYPVFYADDEEMAFPLRTGSENSMTEASLAFSNGLYTSEPITVTVKDYMLNIGAKCDNTNFWCIWDNFELECLGLDEDQENVNVEIGEAGYATLYYSYLNLKAPANVQVFAAQYANDKQIALVPIESGIIPAGTGVIIKGKKGSYKFELVDEEDVDSEPITELLGTDRETYITEENYKFYMLSTKGGDPATIGFYYQNEDGTSINNAAHKCYLKIAAANAPISFTFIDPTGINEVTTTLDNNEVYTISGVRVNNAQQKGIYIINGKKMVVK